MQDTTESSRPVVLIVDDDEEVVETYELWLGATYDLRTATGGEEALERLDGDVDVVLLDRLMPGLSGEEVLGAIHEREVDCRVAMVTAVEPDLDVADMPFDAYVTKALDRETVVETVETLARRAEYDETLQEHYALAEKLATLESRLSAEELRDSDEYRRLEERFRAVDERLRDRSRDADLDAVPFERPDGPDGADGRDGSRESGEAEDPGSDSDGRER